jgi:hypothetical protein
MERGKPTISKAMNEQTGVNRFLHDRMLFKPQQLTQLQKYSSQHIPALRKPCTHPVFLRTMTANT